MSQQTIGIGTTANDGTGDPLRTAFTKVNSNTTDLYTAIHPGFIAGNWYVPRMPGGVFNAGNAPGSGSIKLAAGYVSGTITLNTLGVRITTLFASGNVQAAIYANNAATGRPTGNALASTASMSTTSTGVVSSAVSVQLSQGWYWWAINCDNATAVMATLAVSALELSQLIGSATQGNCLGSSGGVGAVTVAQTFGTWPDLTAGTFVETTGANSLPLVQFKVASVP